MTAQGTPTKLGGVLVALVTVGVLLIVFGGLVLLRFPDRPGGEFEFRGVRIQSVGAGLPLIVLGVVAVALAALQGVAEPGAGAPSPSTSGGGGVPGTTVTTSRTEFTPPPDESTSWPAADCIEQHLDEEPRVSTAFRKPMPMGGTVSLNPMTTFALLLMESGETIGAMRFTYEGGIGPTVLTVYDIVDASCEPGTWTITEVDKGYVVAVTLPGGNYEVAITYDTHPVYPRAMFRRV